MFAEFSWVKSSHFNMEFYVRKKDFPMQILLQVQVGHGDFLR